MFKETLKKLREEKNLTQSELAKILGLSDGSIGNYEQGSREPRNEILKKISDFFNVSVDYLLGFDENKKIESSIISYSGNEKVDSIIKLLLNASIDDNDLNIIKAVLDKYKK